MDDLLRGVVVGVALAAPVGPVGLLCIRLALTQGQWPAVAAGLGAAVADALFGAVAGLGLTVVQQVITTNQTALSILGGTIISVVGVQTLRQRVAFDDRPVTFKSVSKDFITTFSIAITNPATMVVAFGLFAVLGSVDPVEKPGAAFVMVFGVFLGSTLWWIFLAQTSARLRRFVASRLAWINWFSGGLFLLFGLAVLVNAFR